MPRFSANLGFLFAEQSNTGRIEAAAAAGFAAVEMHWPYDTPPKELRAAIDRAGVTMLGLNAPAGDRSRGENGLAALPGREAEFLAGLDLALDYAVALGGTAVHCLAGRATSAAAEVTYLRNLTLAADRAAAAGRTILIEPLNPRDAPGYFLASLDQAVDILARLDRRNVRLMFDCYHLQILGGDLIRRFERVRDLVGHVQIAGVPDRGEPDRGELAYPEILAAFERLGYTGWVGAEYRPRGRTEDGLGWLAAYGAGEPA